MQNISMSELKMADGDRYKLLGNRILLELDKSSEYYELNGRKSIIKIPDRFVRFVYSGTIRAIGNEVENEQYCYQIGQKALFCSTLKGLNLTINDNEYKVIAPFDVEAIVWGHDEIRPVVDRVLIKAVEREAKGMLLLPDTVRQDTCEGVVVSVGDGIINGTGERIPLEVKIDDNIYYSRFSGMQLPVNGEKHILINESNIFFVFEKNG